MQIKNKNRWGGGGQGECEQRIEVIVKMQKKLGGEVRWGGGGGWDQGGCERRIEVIVKMQKKQVAQRARIAHLRTSKYFQIVLK